MNILLVITLTIDRLRLGCAHGGTSCFGRHIACFSIDVDCPLLAESGRAARISSRADCAHITAELSDKELKNIRFMRTVVIYSRAESS